MPPGTKSGSCSTAIRTCARCSRPRSERGRPTASCLTWKGLPRFGARRKRLMAIAFSCSCGKSYSVDNALAGKKTRCPACKASLVVPVPMAELEEPLPELEVIDDDGPATAYGLAGAQPIDDVPEVVEDERPPVTEDDRPPVFEDDRPRVNRDERPEVDEVEEEPGDGRPEYFLAVYPADKTVIYQPKTFRVYPDGDQLLFVHAGPFSWGLLNDLMGPGHVGMRAARAGAGHGAEAGLALGLVAAAITAISDAASRRELKKRAEVLDPMTIEELRAETEKDKQSFVVNADNTPGAQIEPPTTSFWGGKDPPEITGWLKFKHDEAGKWALMLITKADAKAAIRGFRGAMGREPVKVTLRFKKERE